MDKLIRTKSIGVLFWAIAAILIVAEFLGSQMLIMFFKPLLIPCLFVLYILTEKSLCKWYITALFFAFLSNVFLLSNEPELLTYGIVAFLFYRLFSIFTVIKNGDKILFIPLVVATLPFLFLFSYLIYVMVSPENPSFVPTLLNDIIISVFCGISLSAYMLNDSTKNSWLIISTLLFTFLIVVFMFDKFYLSFHIFKPLSALVFACGHFAFYRFMIEKR